MSFRCIEDIQTPGHMIILGSTISGKTCFLRYMLSKIYKRFKYAVVFSSTVGLNNDYGFVQQKYQYTTFEPEVIKGIMSIQREKLKKLKERYDDDEVKKRLPQCLIILDDISGMLDRTRDTCQDIEWLFTTGRHLGISVCALLQDFCMLSPVIRKNTRYYFITKVNGSTYKHLSETVKGFSPREMKDFLEKHCVNYSVLAFDSHGIASITDSRFKINPPHPNKVMKFRIE